MDQEMWYIYTMEYYSAIKKWNLVICNNMDRSWGHYAVRNKSDKERQISDDLTYMQNLKQKKSKTKQKQIPRYREQTGSCQMGGNWGMGEKSKN